MHIVEDNPSRLVLRDRTSWISLLCWMAALIIAVFSAYKSEPKALVTAGLFVAFGIAFFRNSNVIFDKVARSCTVRRRDMWRYTAIDVPFDAIEDVLVEPMIGSDTRVVTPCRLSLLTSRGKVPLSSSYEPDLDRFEETRNSILDSISKQGSTPADADPLGALIRAGRRIDAIALLRRREGLSLEEAMHKVDAVRNREKAMRL